ncbi:hypothetical protein D3C73_807460 [compost metagenome]
MHGLAGQVFTHGRAQYGAAVSHARIWRHPGALQLQFPATVRPLDLAQQVGAPVSQLARPHTELVPAVDRGQRIAARQRLGAGKNLQELGRGQDGRIQAKQRGRVGVGVQKAGVIQALRRQAGIEGSGQRGKRIDRAQFG